MSDLNRIVRILEEAIANRQKLAIGQSIAAIVQGQVGLFLAGGKTISAIATNYCYGNCLLAKVEGKWYAINPNDRRQVVGSSVDRFHKLARTRSSPQKAWIQSYKNNFPQNNLQPESSYPLISISRIDSSQRGYAYVWVPAALSVDFRVRIDGDLTFIENGENPGYISPAQFQIYEILLPIFDYRHYMIDSHTIEIRGTITPDNTQSSTDGTINPYGIMALAARYDPNTGRTPLQGIPAIGLNAYLPGQSSFNLDGEPYMGFAIPLGNVNNAGANSIPLAFEATLIDNGSLGAYDISCDKVQFELLG